MRMQKVARNGSSVAFQNPPGLTEHERLLWKETKELVASPDKEAAERLFAHFVMGPLLGPNHVDAGVNLLRLTSPPLSLPKLLTFSFLHLSTAVLRD